MIVRIKSKLGDVELDSELRLRDLDLQPLPASPMHYLGDPAGPWTLSVRITSGMRRVRGMLCGPWIERTRSGHWLVKGRAGSTRRYRTRSLAMRACGNCAGFSSGANLGEIEAYRAEVARIQRQW